MFKRIYSGMSLSELLKRLAENDKEIMKQEELKKQIEEEIQTAKKENNPEAP